MPTRSEISILVSFSATVIALSTTVTTALSGADARIDLIVALNLLILTWVLLGDSKGGKA